VTLIIETYKKHNIIKKITKNKNEIKKYNYNSIP